MLGGLGIHVVLGESGLTIVVDELGVVLLLLLLLLLVRLLRLLVLVLVLVLVLLRLRGLGRGGWMKGDRGGLVLLLVMGNCLNKLMIVIMGEWRELVLVLEGGSLVVV